MFQQFSNYKSLLFRAEINNLLIANLYVKKIYFRSSQILILYEECKKTEVKLINIYSQGDDNGDAFCLKGK